MIRKIEGFRTHLQRFPFPDYKISGYGQIQLKYSRTFQIVEPQIPVGAQSRLTEGAGIQPMVHVLIAGIGIRVQQLGGLTGHSGQGTVRPSQNREKLGGLDRQNGRELPVTGD
jgi:hypothetical protein